MAAPNDYLLVRLDDNIKDKAVLVYDAAQDRIVDSGLVARNGEIQASAGTVSVGLQDMSSAGEQVLWKNRNSGVNYAPPWGVVDTVNVGGSLDRYYGPMTKQVRFVVDNDILVDPEFEVHVPQDEVAFSININAAIAHTDVIFEVTRNGFEMWRQIIDLSTGIQDIYFEMPISFYAGDYHFKVYTLDGTGVRIKGNAQTNQMAYSAMIRPFYEKQLATQEYVDKIANAVGLGDMQKTVYDTNDNGIVDKAQIAIELEGSSAAQSSTYYGKDSVGRLGYHVFPNVPIISSHAEDDELMTYNSKTNELTGSDTYVIDANMTVPWGNLVLGDTHIVSKGALTAIHNKTSDTIKVPVSSRITATSIEEPQYRKFKAPVRHEHTNTSSSDKFFVNPSFNIQNSEGELWWKIQVDSPVGGNTAVDLYIKKGSTVVSKMHLGDLPQGTNTLALDAPIDAPAHANYTLEFKSDRGDVHFIGEGAEMFYSIEGYSYDWVNIAQSNAFEGNFGNGEIAIYSKTQDKWVPSTVGIVNGEFQATNVTVGSETSTANSAFTSYRQSSNPVAKFGAASMDTNSDGTKARFYFFNGASGSAQGLEAGEGFLWHAREGFGLAKVYTEANKPTAKEIGALATSANALPPKTLIMETNGVTEDTGYEVSNGGIFRHNSPLAALDVSQFDNVYHDRLVVEKDVTNASSINIPIAIPQGSVLSVLSATKKLPDGSLRPVAALDYSYANGNLHIAFGETADVKLTLGIFG